MHNFCGGTESTNLALLMTVYFVVIGLVIGAFTKPLVNLLKNRALDEARLITAILFIITVGFGVARQPQSFCMYGHTWFEGYWPFLWIIGYTSAISWVLTHHLKRKPK